MLFKMTRTPASVLLSSPISEESNVRPTGVVKSSPTNPPPSAAPSSASPSSAAPSSTVQSSAVSSGAVQNGAVQNGGTSSDLSHSERDRERARAASTERPARKEASDSPESGVRLADIREAMLDDAELRSLFSDIATYGKVLEATVKPSPRSRPELIRRLPELYLKLVERRVFGAQIRYEFDDGVWLDTLMATPSGVRLVRVRLPD